MTKDLLLVYEGSSLKIKSYTDSSFQFDVDDSKSDSGYLFTLNKGAVCLKMKKLCRILLLTQSHDY